MNSVRHVITHCVSRFLGLCFLLRKVKIFSSRFVSGKAFLNFSLFQNKDQIVVLVRESQIDL